MAGWVEREVKWLLPDAEARHRVREATSLALVADQTNHFFDRADRALRSRRIGVRLRHETARAIDRPLDVCTLTLKGDAQRQPGGALVRRIELETPIDCQALEAALSQGLELAPWLERFRHESEAAPAPPELDRFLADLEQLCGHTTLRRHAGFSNRRETRIVALRDAQGELEIELALDETCFPDGRIDFEIEIEIAEGASTGERIETTAARWLAGLGIQGIVPASSKLGRLEACLARLEAGTHSAAPER